MQNLQTELKIQWKFASQATPSPRAKATMETLDRTQSDLSYHYDSVVQSLKQLNGKHKLQRTDSGDNGSTSSGSGGASNGCSETKNPDGKPVDKKVQNADKKGNLFIQCPIQFNQILKKTSKLNQFTSTKSDYFTHWSLAPH